MKDNHITSITIPSNFKKSNVANLPNLEVKEEIKDNPKQNKYK